MGSKGYAHQSRRHGCAAPGEAGAIDAEDFSKLNNFCQFALALMRDRGPAEWEDAKQYAEIASFIHSPTEMEST